LCWVAPGSAWGDGTAASYQLRAYSGMARPEPETFTRGRALRGLPVPRAAGTGQCIRVARLPAHTRWLSLRAINGAGLISYPADVRVS
jgi:hypothetical protein